MKNQSISLLALIAVTGCASIFDGTSQQITVNTNPSGAKCAISRDKEGVIGMVNSTPGSATVKKTKEDITITCNKYGYQQATYLNHSGIAGATYANIIGGLLGAAAWGIDSSVGADNKYDSPINISMVPNPQPVMMPEQTQQAPIPTQSAPYTQTAPVMQQPVVQQPIQPVPYGQPAPARVAPASQPAPQPAYR